jgi:hypothetical protein
MKFPYLKLGFRLEVCCQFAVNLNDHLMRLILPPLGPYSKMSIHRDYEIGHSYVGIFDCRRSKLGV